MAVTPAECLRIELAAARRQGDEFDRAWGRAVEVAVDGAPRRAEWLIAFEVTRDAWCAAYNRRGRAPLVDAMDALGLAEIVGEDARVHGHADSRLVA